MNSREPLIRAPAFPSSFSIPHSSLLFALVIVASLHWLGVQIHCEGDFRFGSVDDRNTLFDGREPDGSAVDHLDAEQEFVIACGQPFDDKMAARISLSATHRALCSFAHAPRGDADTRAFGQRAALRLDQPAHRAGPVFEDDANIRHQRARPNLYQRLRNSLALDARDDEPLRRRIASEIEPELPLTQSAETKASVGRDFRV